MPLTDENRQELIAELEANLKEKQTYLQIFTVIRTTGDFASSKELSYLIALGRPISPEMVKAFAGAEASDQALKPMNQKTKSVADAELNSLRKDIAEIEKLLHESTDDALWEKKVQDYLINETWIKNDYAKDLALSNVNSLLSVMNQIKDAAFRVSSLRLENHPWLTDAASLEMANIGNAIEIDFTRKIVEALRIFESDWDDYSGDPKADVLADPLKLADSIIALEQEVSKALHGFLNRQGKLEPRDSGMDVEDVVKLFDIWGSEPEVHADIQETLIYWAGLYNVGQGGPDVDPTTDVLVDENGDTDADVVEPFKSSVKSGSAKGEAIVLGQGDDYGFGNAGADTLTGTDKRETLSGGSENDTIDGKGGDDFILGETGEDILSGGTGNDTLLGGTEGDLIRGNEDNDVLYGQGGEDELYGDAGDDTLFGGADDDRLYGGIGEDALKGGTGNDILKGGEGADHLYAGSGNDQLHGGAGQDTYYFKTGDGVNYVYDDGGTLNINGRTITAITQIASQANAYEDNFGNTYFYSPDSIVVKIGGSDQDIILIRDNHRSAPASSVLTGNLSNTAGAAASSLPLENFVATVHGPTATPEPTDTLHIGDGDLQRLGVTNGRIVSEDGTVNQLQTAYIGRQQDGYGDVNNRSLILHADQFNWAVTEPGHFGNAGGYFEGGNADDRLHGNDKQNAFLGLADDDHLFGYGNNDMLQGGSGSDTLIGGEGQDMIFGAVNGPVGESALEEFYSAEFIYDQAGDHNYLEGNGGSDFISGGQYSDTISGGTEADYLHGNTGSDQLFGDAGDDVVFGDSGHAYVLGGNAQGNIYEVNFLDNPTSGDDFADLIHGGDGRDYLVGEHGDDIVNGGNGNDRIYGDRPETVDSNDILLGNLNAITAAGSDFTLNEQHHGDDILFGGAGNDWISGDGGNDRIHGDEGDDVVWAGSGDDVVEGNHGADDIRGETGQDTLHGNQGADTLSGGDGDDTLHGGEDADQLYGGNDNDRLFGGDGDDLLRGNDGNDSLQGGAGNDRLEGGAGNDTYRFGRGDGIDQIIDGEGAHILDIRGADSAADLFLYQDDARTAIGFQSGSDRLWMSNADFAGVSAIRLNGAPIAVSDLKGQEHVPVNAAPDGGDTPGTELNDVMTGSDQADKLRGEAGDDILDGRGGNDSLHGGTGHNVIRFGKGYGIDTLYSDPKSADTSNVIALTPEVGVDDVQIFRSEENQADPTSYLVIQVAGQDELRVRSAGRGPDGAEYNVSELRFADGKVWNLEAIAAGLNHLYLDAAQGVGGNIQQYGSGGYWLRGEDGDDLLKGASNNDDLDAFAGNDQLYGLDGDDRLFGGAGDDLLVGGKGDDQLAGGDGNDLLDGGAGNDRLSGGAGNDVYRFGHGHGRDIIAESDSGFDRILMTETVAQADVSLDRNANDLMITLSDGDHLTVNDYFAQGRATIDEIAFADGAVWTQADVDGMLNTATDLDNTLYGSAGADNLSALAGNDFVYGFAGDDQLHGGAGHDELRGGDDSDHLIGGAGDDTLYGDIDVFSSEAGLALPGSNQIVYEVGDDLLEGGAGHDILFGGRGNDRLSGGTGDDRYLFEQGDGQDVIHTGGGNDVIELMDVAREDLAFERHGDHLRIQFAGATDQITVENWFLGAEQQAPIKLLQRGFGLGLSEPVLISIEEINAHTTTDHIHASTGGDAQEQSGGEPLSTSGQAASGQQNSDQQNSDQQSSNQRNYDNHLETGPMGGQLVGAGGADHLQGSAQADALFGLSGNDRLIGGDGADYLDGGEGDDIQDAGAGNDQLGGDAGNDLLIGGAGDDYYIYRPGSGADVIDNQGGGADWILFTGDITQDRLRFLQDGDDLIIRIDDDATQQIRVRNHFLGGDWSVPYIQPAAGSGFATDSLPVTVMESGGAGSETNVTGGSHSSDGSDVNATEPNSDLGGASTDSSAVADANGGESQTTTESTTPILGGDDQLTGSASGDVLIGGYGHDQLAGGAGDDHLLGGVGDDTYLYTGGQDVLEEASGTDTIIFAAGITFNDVASGLSRSGDDLILYVRGGPDSVTLKDFFLGGDGLIETLRFETGGELTAQQLFGAFGLAMPDVASEASSSIDGSNGDDAALTGRVQNDRIQGFDGNDQLMGEAGDDHLDGGNGADHLQGGSGADRLIGGRGNDTYLFNAGDGQDIIDNRGGGFDTLRFAGIDFNQIASGLMKSGDDLILQSGADKVTVQDFFKGGDHAVDVIEFASGGQLTADQLFGVFGIANPDTLSSPDYQRLPDERAFGNLFSGDAGNQRIQGSSDADLLDGGAGDDQLSGNRGDDYLMGGNGSDAYHFAQGDGRDTINNLSADQSEDSLHFAAGIDETQLWFSQSGNDLMIDLLGADDRVTVQDWYSDAAQQIDVVQTEDAVISATQIEQLVTAMAAFGAPAGGEVNLSPDERTQAEATIAASWQPV